MPACQHAYTRTAATLQIPHVRIEEEGGVELAGRVTKERDHGHALRRALSCVRRPRVALGCDVPGCSAKIHRMRGMRSRRVRAVRCANIYF